jgi:hypothetical protein
MKSTTLRRSSLLALSLAAAVAPTGCTSDPSQPSAGAGEQLGEGRAAWETVSVTDPSKSTHLWIVSTALNMISANGLAADPKQANLVALLMDGTSECGAQMRQGLYDADYLPEYNDGIDTDQDEISMLYQAWQKGGWKSHFYDPSTGQNYEGGTSPTALTQATAHWNNSVQEASAAGGVTSGACYELGLALHYMTDVTQPMHATNFTNESFPLGCHSDYEGWVMNTVQSTVTQPSPTADVYSDQAAVVIAAANAARASYYVDTCGAIPCICAPLGGLNVSSDSVPKAQGMLQSAAQFTTIYLESWLGSVDDYVATATVATPFDNTVTAAASCDADELAVGIYGGYGSAQYTPGVLGLGFYCATITADGTWTSVRQTNMTGNGAGWSTTSFQEQCPAGYAMSGLRANIVTSLVGMGITCRSINDPGAAPYVSNIDGLSGTLTTADCPSGQFFNRFVDNSWNYQYQVVGVCMPTDPAWSGWTDLGPLPGSMPLVATDADGMLELFAPQSNGSLVTNTEDSTTSGWSGWSAISPGGLISNASLGGASAQVVALDGESPGKLTVFSILTSGDAGYVVQDPSATNGWGNWESLSAHTLDPAALAVGKNADGRLELFAIGSDSAVYHTSQQSAGSTTWSGWHSLGGSLFGNTPVVGKNSDGRLEVFAPWGDGQVHHIWQQSGTSNGWSGWSSLGGAVGPFAVGTNQDGRLELFQPWFDLNVHHIWQQSGTSNGWSSWESLGSSGPSGFGNTPVVGNDERGRLVVFDSDGTDLYVKWHQR